MVVLQEQVCAQTHADSPSPDSLTEIQQSRRALSLHYKDMTKKASTRTAEQVFEQGDKNGCILAMLVADSYASTVISCIYSPSGSLVSSREEILNALSPFMQHCILFYPT